MRASRSLLALVVFAAALSGCASSRNQDLLEAKLREQEQMLSSYQAQLDRVQRDLELARRESDDLRSRLAGSGGAAVPTDEADAHYRVMGVQFSPLMTGGTDLDRQPGDDAVTVVLFPHDAEGELVKLPAAVQIEAFDLSRAEGAQRIGQWSFDITEARGHWHNGVIQSGYQFELPWQERPQSESLLLHGRLMTSDGRQFDATHTVRITPPTAEEPYPSPGQGGSGIEQVSATGRSGGGIQRLGGFVGDAQPTPAGARPAGHRAATGESVIRLGETSPVGIGSHSTEVRGGSRTDADRRSPRTPHAGEALTGREFADRMNIDAPLEVVPREASDSIGRSSPWGHRPPQRNSTPWNGGPPPSQPGGHSTESSPDPRPRSIRDATPHAAPRANDLHSTGESESGAAPGEPRPFPNDLLETRRPLLETGRPLQTSDAWTDETIPYVR